jgi:hypothetical protein
LPMKRYASPRAEMRRWQCAALAFMLARRPPRRMWAGGSVFCMTAARSCRQAIRPARAPLLTRGPAAHQLRALAARRKRRRISG